MNFRELRGILIRELGPEQGESLAATLCRECPGEVIYVTRRPAPPAISHRDTPRTLQARFGISRQTSYVWLRKLRR